MKSAKQSVSAAAMLALVLAIARLASPIAGLHRLGPVSGSYLARPAPSVAATTSVPADDGSGDDGDDDEDGGDSSSG